MARAIQSRKQKVSTAEKPAGTGRGPSIERDHECLRFNDRGKRPLVETGRPS
jgi:hypothetical protein